MLTDLYLQTTGQIWDKDMASDKEVLLKQVANWAGLRELNPIVDCPIDDDSDIGHLELTELNDDFLLNFRDLTLLIVQQL